MLQPETATAIAGDGPHKLPSLISFFLSKFASGNAASGSIITPTALKRRFPKPAGYNRYSWAEIAKHTTPEDAWLVVEDRVYDVSAMDHPGGDVLFSYAGRDATEVFNVMHKNQPKARAIMKAYLIGEVAVPERTALLQDWNAMRERFEEQGLLNASPVYYVRKIAELLAMAAAAGIINYYYGTTSTAALLLSSAIMGTFFYQVGWTQHDFQHNAVFRSHKKNAVVGGLVISVGLGGSAHWWKTKHNQHHATPNKMSADEQHAVDPDIDTIPLIAWSEALLKQVSASDRKLVVLQHVLTWPLLFLALINWQVQSLIHALSYPKISVTTSRAEVAMIVVHHIWTMALGFVPLGLYKGLLFWLLSHAIGGFVIAFVFIQSHNAMEIYTDDKDFVTSQLVSTRNINPGLLADWIMGGLNYQIEHHLFPTMPRHSFSRVRRDIMQLCARHGLPYESCSIWESTSKVYNQLAAIAKLA